MKTVVQESVPKQYADELRAFMDKYNKTACWTGFLMAILGANIAAAGIIYDVNDVFILGMLLGGFGLGFVAVGIAYLFDIDRFDKQHAVNPGGVTDENPAE